MRFTFPFGLFGYEPYVSTCMTSSPYTIGALSKTFACLKWCGNGRKSGSADSGLFGWKWKRKQLRGTTSCFRFHVSILRLSPEKISWFLWDCGKKYFWVELGWLFWKSHLSNPVKKKSRKMFHFINIFMEVTWKHGSRSRIHSSLQILLEAEVGTEAKVHRLHITAAAIFCISR